MRGILKFVLITGLLVAASWYPLVLHSPKAASPPGYSLDIAAVRELARSPRGPFPSRLRVETVAEFQFAEAMVMAGEAWQSTPIPIYAFKLEYPGGWLVIDTAMPNIEAMPDVIVSMFDEAALQRVYQAMSRADGIYITHEHFDHIGGVVAHPDIASLLPRVHLTREQFAHPDRMRPLSYPAAFDDYQPLDYQGMKAIAPGVVLIKAPGHTPGSQIVYIQFSDGRELLLLGDVAWQMRNIDAVRERPLFMTALIKEDRSQVIDQFQVLHDLRAQAPQLAMLPGHDGRIMQQLIEQGLITPGF